MIKPDLQTTPPPPNLPKRYISNMHLIKKIGTPSIFYTPLFVLYTLFPYYPPKKKLGSKFLLIDEIKIFQSVDYINQ